jgi:small neutral amino acid transporter SnatA (MarC family)
MKFHFNFEILVGAALILWGISIFLKLIWGIDLPIFKALAAIFLIYLGLSMLFDTKTKMSYSSKTFHYTVKEDDKRD